MSLHEQPNTQTKCISNTCRKADGLPHTHKLKSSLTSMILHAGTRDKNTKRDGVDTARKLDAFPDIDKKAKGPPDWTS